MKVNKTIAKLLGINMLISPALSQAAVIPGLSSKITIPAPDPATLPQGGSILSGVSGIVQTPGKNELVINQNASRAIINWEKFNIGAAAAVRFNQKNNDGVAQKDWVVINRIYDASPSAIYGNLTADYKVYLINRNGIFFGAGSQVDVHSLTASALNITNENFSKGLLRFTTETYDDSQGALAGDTTISNYGTITTDSGGSVFFVGPIVENAGTISSPAGKINLVAVKSREDGAIAADGEVEITQVTTSDTAVDVTYSDSQVMGEAYNLAGGKLVVDTGRVGMYGATVQQDGLIRAVTALKKGGVVYLAARDKISTGAQSVIETPVDDSTETAHPTFDYSAGNVTLTGINITTGGYVPLQQIEHLGAITAPSGTVTLNASANVTLGGDSSINVAGLWLDRDASANLLEAQLNSVELRDEFAQKDGILSGEKIKVDVLTGSNIGNLSGYYLGVDTSAQERSSKGGSISITGVQNGLGSPLGELTVNDGAILDFSGGGIRYAAGNMATSKLISGSRVYDISTAPKDIQYDGLADSQTKTYKRFGITEEFKGLYFGGGSSVGNFTAGRVVGNDAGSAALQARVMTLDGVIKGSATSGLYQTNVTSTDVDDSSDTYTISRIRGLEKALGGSLQLGNKLSEAPSGANSYGEDAVLLDVVIQPTTAKSDSNETPTSNITRISADILNSAGLSFLGIYADNTISIEQGACLSLLPGASLTAIARRIEQQGDIEIPGGSVTLGIRDTISAWENLPSDPGTVNPLYKSLVETINLSSGSIISVAGQQIGNSAVTDGQVSAATTSGGSIRIVDASFQSDASYSGKSTDVFGNTVPAEGHAINLAQGALLDVSGGYLIDANGKISGGDAGSLTLKASTLSLDGELRGYSLPGENGGAITLHAGEVVVQHGEALPDNSGSQQGKLVLNDSSLRDTGFTRISLISINDLNFIDGAELVPSTVKLSMPLVTNISQGNALINTVIPSNSDPADADYLGVTSLSLTAGKNIYSSDLPLFDNEGNVSAGSNSLNKMATIDIASGTGLTAAPGGEISLTAPLVDIAGTLNAPGGTITAAASGTTALNGNLTIEETGRILALGYDKPDSSLVAGLPAGSVPEDGGTVTLSADSNIIMKQGSKIDVSASVPGERLVLGDNGKPVKVLVAGNPGSLSLSTGAQLALDGEIAGKSSLAGQSGGTLTVASKQDLTIKQADVDFYIQSGFDALNFVSANIGASGSPGGIIIQDNLDISAGRSLTLDAMSIRGGGNGGDVTLQAPWIKLTNTLSTINKQTLSASADTGTRKLTLNAGFIDIEGNVLISGFKDVNLESGRDIRFANRVYTLGTNVIFGESLGVTGNLTLQAGRIYPTSATRYTITSNGKVTTLGSTKNGIDLTPVYSAGGSLTIKAAQGIEHNGLLEAPMGSVTLDGGADGQVYLAEGSRIVTGGSVPVSYGSYDGESWTVRSTNADGSASSTSETVTDAPEKSITLTGKDIIVKEGATLDFSGGGSVYTSLWQSGIQGSLNPLTIPNRYVILRDNSVTLPGQAVYLGDVPSLGLKAGTYSILPIEYAFVPGALVIENIGTQMVAGQKALSSQGYQIVAGRETVMDTSITSQSYTGYIVRSATEVLKEGDFTAEKKFTAGNGGDLTLAATNGAVMDGQLNAQPLQGYQGGVLTLSANNVIAQSVATALSAGLKFGAGLDNTLIVNSDAVSGKGFEEVALGSRDTTETVTVKSGSTLQAPSITLHANENVTIESDAEVHAEGDGNSGIAAIDVPEGTFTLAENGVLRASNGIKLDVSNTVLAGDMLADNGIMSLASDKIIFASDTDSQAEKALYLTQSRWDQFSSYDNLTLISRGDMLFLRDVELSTKGALTLDTGRYTVDSATSTPVNVSFSADGKLTLLNSGTTAQTGPAGGDSSLKFTSTGAGIDIIPRTNGIAFDRFGTVTLNSFSDVTLHGAGTVKAAGDLNINAPRVTTSFYQYDANPTNNTDVSIPYTVADITIDARNGNVNIAGNGGTAGISRTPGGSLEILGASVTQTGAILEVPSGELKLTATGDITIGNGASVLAKGIAIPAKSGTVSYYNGGLIALQSSAGAINLAGGSTLDVSASGQGDAGSITLSAATNDVTMSGVVNGSAANGQGGALSIDTLSLAGAGTGGVDGLSTMLSDGGFNNQISIRTRSGDISLSNGKTLTGREVTVAADGGAIDLSGAINADGVKDGEAGGRVELYAKTTLTLENGSSISAKGAEGADGGTVELSSLAPDKIADNYALQVKSGSNIDVSGETGGTVSFRAYELPGGTDVNMAPLPVGAITNASRVAVEEAKKYTVNGNIGAFGAPYNSFMSNAAMATLKSSLFENVLPADLAKYHLQAGIELVGADDADLTLNTAWNLTQARPGGEAGVLTLWSSNNVLINNSLYDIPTAMDALYNTSMQNSWGINLVAGAETSAANYKAVATGNSLPSGNGNLTIARNATVYSENAPIYFAAGNDATLAGWSATNGPGYMINTFMKYNLGSYGGTVSGTAGNNLNMNTSGSAIQTALGDIDIKVGNNLDLGTAAGAIRTTGEYDNTIKNIEVTKDSELGVRIGAKNKIYQDADLKSYWLYHNGGNIRLDVGRALIGTAGSVTKGNKYYGWDAAYIGDKVPKTYLFGQVPKYLGASFGDTTYMSNGSNPDIPSTEATIGIATLGGGDITVRTGGSFLTPVGAFGTLNESNVNIISGGNLDGRFRIMNGSLNMLSAGGFGAKDSQPVIEMAAASVSVAAQSDVYLGAVFNPDNSRYNLFSTSFNNASQYRWNLTYDQDSSASIASLAGDLTFYGSIKSLPAYFSDNNATLLERTRILPPSFALTAAVNLNLQNTFYLAPSTSGNLELFAGKDINGSYKMTENNTASLASFIMADAPIDSIYGWQQTNVSDPMILIRSITNHYNTVLHQNDSQPVQVIAGEDISDIWLTLNKVAEISAGNDITGLDFIGQNTQQSQVTTITAGGSINQGYTLDDLINHPKQRFDNYFPGIILGGPGDLLVTAGSSINLGNSRGIQTNGNALNPILAGDADLTVVVGARKDLLPSEAVAFFYGADGTNDHADDALNGLQKAGDDYSTLKAAGDIQAAQEKIDQARTSIISPLFDEWTEDTVGGDINMTRSEIKTVSGDIQILAKGILNLGVTSLSTKSKESTGITTSFGGQIALYSGSDINVNESRVMTYMGGNITMWSDQGNINAGRGSKTTVSASPPKATVDSNGNVVGFTYPAPSVGSGVRALTYDPDGTTGPLDAPLPGDIYMFAPKGVIDAGEAGIAGGKVTLGATRIDGSENISFSAGSVGVPTSSEGSVSIGALAGAGSITDSSKMMEQSSAMGSAREKSNVTQAGLVDDFMSRFLDVKVIGFDMDSGMIEKEKKDQDKKDK